LRTVVDTAVIIFAGVPDIPPLEPHCRS